MFTYVIEEGSNRGYIIIIYEGERKNKTEGLLYFTNENDLSEALKIYEKSAILVAYPKKELLIEGKRLSKKLNIEFLHS